MDIESESSAESEVDEDLNENALMQYQNIEVSKSSSMWYLMYESLGTVLKVLAPVTILSWFYRHDSLIFRIFLQCDRTIRSVISPRQEQRDGILRWLQDIFPEDERTKSLDVIWSDGSLICDIVESVIPGSCPGHIQGQKMDLGHAQRLAEQYLGVRPIFTNDELAQKYLTTYKECKLTHYLTNIREALTQLSPPISRCGSPILNVQAFTLDYVARGMGLMGAMENRKAIFYIYPTAQQGLEPGDISVQIKGPDCCYGSTLIPALYARTHIVRSVLMNLGHQQNIPILNSIRGKGRFSAKILNDIEVKAVVKSDKIKVAYIPVKRGYHELSLISKGCHIVGSPFKINVDSKCSTGRQFSMYDEDEHVTQEVQKTDRKVVFRIVDFVTEKMILTEDGNLEKLSEDEAKELLHRVESIENMKRMKAITNSYSEPDVVENNPPRDHVERDHLKKNYFKRIGEKVSLLLRFCRELKNGYFDPKPEISQADSASRPDIINMTLGEDVKQSAKDMRKKFKDKYQSFNRTNDAECYSSKDSWDCEINDTDESTANSGDYVKSKNSRTPSIDIIITSFDEEDEIDRNESTRELVFERPKTPVFKILSDEHEAKSNDFHGFDKNQYEGQFDSLELYVNNEIERCYNSKISLDDGEERYTPSIDFHIGEPVTPTPMMNYTHSDVDMDSIILASNLEEALLKYDRKLQDSVNDQDQYPSEESCPSKYSTPFRQTPFELMTDNEIISMYEAPPENNDLGTIIKVGDAKVEKCEASTVDAEECKKLTNISSVETIDSAYVSTDELNTSDTTNSTPKSDTSLKIKLYSIDECIESRVYDDYCNMGPAEKEIWKSMTIYKNDKMKRQKKFNTKNNDDSLKSDYIADIKLSETEEQMISSIQNNNAEFKDENHNSQITLSTEDYNLKSEFAGSLNNSPTNRTPTKRNLSKMISEKKEYWDDKIQSIRIEKKKINNNQVLKKSTSETQKPTIMNSAVATSLETNSFDDWGNMESPSPNQKLVEKWKNYWNEKLEKCSTPDLDTVYMHKELTKSRRFLASPDADEIDAIFYSDDKLEAINIGYKEKNLECVHKEEKKLDDKIDDVNQDSENKSVIIEGLSKRIDRFLDTLSSMSPINENVEFERFSTPSNQFEEKLANKDQTNDMLNGNETSLLNIKKNEKRIIVTWNSNSTEKLMSSLSGISNPPSPFPMLRDEIVSKIELEEEFPSKIINCDETINKAVPIKTKIENFNRAAAARSSFASSRAYTSDIPRMASFKKLQKYFSLDSVEKCVEMDDHFDDVENDETNPDVLTLEESEPHKTMITKAISTDSLPSLSEKKAVIELHLKAMQNKIKSQSNPSKTPQLVNKRSEEASNIVKASENKIDIQAEISQIIKPIGAIVAKFENHKNNTTVLTDAVCNRGTNKRDLKDASITAKQINGYKEHVGSATQQLKFLNTTETKIKESAYDGDEFIQTEQHKKRFRRAIDFFENLKGNKQNHAKESINECEKLLQEKIIPKNCMNQDEQEKPTVPPRNKFINNEWKRAKFKAHSVPEINIEIECEKSPSNTNNNRLEKISEKFLVKDLFQDIIGDSKRIGLQSFKGIPHKMAVLAAFNSMEDINQLSSYEYTERQLMETNEKRIVQKYFNEFPYLPITDSNKSRPRLNFAASGLMLRKDFLKLQKSRRNSAPSSFCIDPILCAS